MWQKIVQLFGVGEGGDAVYQQIRRDTYRIANLKKYRNGPLDHPVDKEKVQEVATLNHLKSDYLLGVVRDELSRTKTPGIEPIWFIARCVAEEKAMRQQGGTLSVEQEAELAAFQKFIKELVTHIGCELSAEDCFTHACQVIGMPH